MKQELLSPAGSMDALKMAVYHGADAVYLGGKKFGARAFADNFTEMQQIFQKVKCWRQYFSVICMELKFMLR